MPRLKLVKQADGTYKDEPVPGKQQVSLTVGRSVGLGWSAAGWLIPRFLDRIGEAATQALHRRVVEELGTTFRSGYGEAVSLADLLDPGLLMRISERKTGARCWWSRNTEGRQGAGQPRPAACWRLAITTRR